MIYSVKLLRGDTPIAAFECEFPTARPEFMLEAHYNTIEDTARNHCDDFDSADIHMLIDGVEYDKSHRDSEFEHYLRTGIKTEEDPNKPHFEPRSRTTYAE